MIKILKYLCVFIILFSCKQENKSTEYPLIEYAAWAPDNHYFRASLIQLHFLTETESTDQLKKIYAQNINNFNLPTSPVNLPDGSYSGTSPFDAFDYCHQMELDIKQGKIVSVHYDEIHRDGHSKKMDKQYGEMMKSGGTTPNIAYESMQKQLLELQSFDSIDAVSGATYSLYRFKYAGMLALMKAQLIDHTSKQ